jgi:hypothetical protein
MLFVQSAAESIKLGIDTGGQASNTAADDDQFFAHLQPSS